MQPDVLFCTDSFWAARGNELCELDPALETVLLVGDEQPNDDDVARMTIANFSVDAWPHRVRRLLGTCVRAPNLRWLHSSSAGTDDAVFAQLRARDVLVTSGAGAAAPVIAQTVVMYLLALSRELPAMLNDQADRHWNPRRVRDLTGLRLGIVGLGSIGVEVARLANALGIEVVATRRTVTGDEPCTTWTGDRLPELLAWADAIAITAPLTEATRGLIDTEALATMRRGAWLLNVGRGAIVDERALIEALESGHIGAAALDVFAIEPLPAESALWSMPNVIITPHCSGESDLADRRSDDLFVENFRRRVIGEALLNVTASEPGHEPAEHDSTSRRVEPPTGNSR